MTRLGLGSGSHFSERGDFPSSHIRSSPTKVSSPFLNQLLCLTLRSCCPLTPTLIQL